MGAPLEGGPKLSWESVKESLAKSAEAWHLYRSQEVFPAALALALNSLTVLNLVGPFCLTSIHLPCSHFVIERVAIACLYWQP